MLPPAWTAPSPWTLTTIPLVSPVSARWLPVWRFLASGTSGSTLFNVVDTQTAAVSTDGLANFTDVEIFEGAYLTEDFVVDESIYNQVYSEERVRCRLQVYSCFGPRKTQTKKAQTQYTPAKSLTQVKDTDRAYWTTRKRRGYTELIFGDGLFGRKLQNGATITVKYIVCNGTAGNGIRGASNFNFAGSVTDSYGGAITVRPTISRVDVTGGGSGREDVAAIKFRAPRSYANQNRCVAKDDYAAIVKDIYPAIDDIFVYGGEELETPQFGRVFIVVKPAAAAQKLSTYAKQYIKESLEDFRVASLDIQIVDPEVIYVEVVTSVFYDSKVSDKSAAAITARVKDALTEYSTSTNLSPSSVVLLSSLRSFLLSTTLIVLSLVTTPSFVCVVTPLWLSTPLLPTRSVLRTVSPRQKLVEPQLSTPLVSRS